MGRVRRFFELVANSSIGRKAVIFGGYLSIFLIFLCIPSLTSHFFPPQSLCVYGFTDMFHPESIVSFERSNKVKVILRYFESNEELLAKFQISRGVGYDVIVSSDYMIKHLRKENLLLTLDHQKISCLRELDPHLLNQSYDPNNQHTVPLSWIPYGIIFHKSLFKDQPKEVGLHLLFEAPILRTHGTTGAYRICMTDDSREALFLANLYLYNNIDSWQSPRLEKIEALLINQKNWVESYVNQDLTYQLLSGVIKAAFAPLFTVDKVLKSSNDFTFMIPKEGSLYAIENLAIPKCSKQADLAHKFINYMLSTNESARMSNYYGMHPANKSAYAFLRPEVTLNKHIFPDDACFARLHLTPNEIPTKQCEDTWLAVKSS